MRTLQILIALGIVAQLLTILAVLRINNVLKKGIKIMAQLDDQIASLQSTVAAETDVENSAIALINGIPALIQSAIASAQAAGASPVQLQALNDLQAKIASSSSSLASAVTTNTPAA